MKCEIGEMKGVRLNGNERNGLRGRQDAVFMWEVSFCGD
jgi:hypothetical protein